MKEYTFRIVVDKSNSKQLKKKSFKLKLRNDIDKDDPQTMMEEAVEYLTSSPDDYFRVRMDDFIEFEIIRGNHKARCALENEFCSRCGGVTEIWGEYVE